MQTIGPTPFNVKALRRFLALSNHPLSRAARRVRGGVLHFELPAPKVVVWPMLCGFVAARSVYHFLKRKLICEPCLKAYCTTYGRRLRTGVFFPWVEGPGEIHLGDGVYFHGKFSISFALRFSERPTLTIGDNTGFGHEVMLAVGKRITIGRNCLISSRTMIVDSGGHPVDPLLRLAGLPPLAEEVRPVTIEDNVWIATGSIILPGVTIGEGSVISAGSVVRRSVPPYSLVMGNPAKVLAPLPRPEPGEGPLVPMPARAIGAAGSP
jgi:serine acetyltransferase